MTIESKDIKLFESQKLTDDEDGGGRATGRVVLSGAFNNLFQDISRLDRTVGDVSLRKAFAGVDTPTDETYLGSHAIISEMPGDDRVSVLIYKAVTEGDTRADAKDRIESYVTRSAASSINLLGNQLVGQRQIVAFQRVEAESPGVGDVFVIKKDSDEQFVRITSADSSVERFTYLLNNNFYDFERRKLVLGISSPLQFTFPGGIPRPDGIEGDHADVFTTQVADASRYYGATKSSSIVNVGDLKIPVNSVYSALVPSAQKEEPLVDRTAARSNGVIVAAGPARSISATLASIGSGRYRCFAPRAIVPGSAKFSGGGFVFQDDGKGKMILQSGSWPSNEIAVDYATGIISIDGVSSNSSYTGSLEFTPGAVNPSQTTSGAIGVSIANRSYNYTLNLAGTKPRPGTLVVSYMALGKWYSMADIGAGSVEGAGSGLINFATGTVSITLAALADVGSSIMFDYVVSIDDELESHAGTASVGTPEFTLNVDPGVKPGALDINYTQGGETKTVNDSSGELTGDGTGFIDYGTGLLKIRPNLIPDDGTEFIISFREFPSSSSSQLLVPDSAGFVSGIVPDAPLLPGSVSLYARVKASGSTRGFLITDNGEGGWGSIKGDVSGTINYTNGELNVQVTKEYTETTWRQS